MGGVQRQADANPPRARRRGGVPLPPLWPRPFQVARPKPAQNDHNRRARLRFIQDARRVQVRRRRTLQLRTGARSWPGCLGSGKNPCRDPEGRPRPQTLAFSPSSELLASGGEDRAVKESAAWSVPCMLTSVRCTLTSVLCTQDPPLCCFTICARTIARRSGSSRRGRSDARSRCARRCGRPRLASPSSLHGERPPGPRP
jgi:hypothetical protein